MIFRDVDFFHLYFFKCEKLQSKKEMVECIFQYSAIIVHHHPIPFTSIQMHTILIPIINYQMLDSTDTKEYELVCQRLKQYDVVQGTLFLWDFTHQYSSKGGTRNQEKITKTFNMKGPERHAHAYQKIIKQFYQKYFRSPISCTPYFQKGVKFCDFKDQMDGLTQKNVDLVHKEGEILVLVPWKSDRYSTQIVLNMAKMVDKNENWKDKVRTVLIMIEPNIYTSKNFISDNKQIKFQHYQFPIDRLGNSIAKCLKKQDELYMVIVNQRGIVQDICQHQKWNIKKIINNLLNQESMIVDLNKPKEQQKMCAHYVLKKGVNDFRSLEKIMNGIHKQLKIVPDYKLQQRIAKVFQNGQHVNYFFRQQLISLQNRNKDENYRKFVNLMMVENHQAIPKEVYEQEVDLDLHSNRYLMPGMQYFLDLTSRYKTLGMYFKQTFTKRPLKSTKWKSHIISKHYQIQIDEDLPLKKFYELKQLSDSYTDKFQRQQKNKENLSQKQSQDDQGIILDAEYLRSPSKISACFIDNQIHLSADLTKTISLYKRYYPLVILFNGDKIQKYFLQKLIQAVKLAKNDSQIIILTKKVTSLLQDLQKRNNHMFNVYKTKQQPEQFYFQTESPKNMIVVDKNGIVLEAGYIRLPDLTKLLKVTYQQDPNYKISIQSIAGIKQQVRNLDLKQIIRNIQQNLNYWPIFNISFSRILEYRQDYRKPRIFIKVRESEETLFDSLIPQLESIGKLKIQVVETFKIPMGIECNNCRKKLTFPHYYYYFSSTFRCVECAEKEKWQILNNPMGKYQVKQNGVLVFREDTEVDVQRFGKNIQPKQKSQCILPTFKCRGCDKSIEDIRYICMGCQREPSELKYKVDFCKDCTKALKSGVVEQKLLSNLDKVKHREDHALLRLVFSPNGYHIY